MSLLIPCPHCGIRPIREFLYGEIPTVPDSQVDLSARDFDRGFMHTNHDGKVVERWFHQDGCRRWVTVERDTGTDRVIATLG